MASTNHPQTETHDEKLKTPDWTNEQDEPETPIATARKTSSALENGQSTSTTTLVAFTAIDDESIDEKKSKPSWKKRHVRLYNGTLVLVLNALIIGYFAWATYHHVDISHRYEEIKWPPVNVTAEDREDAAEDTCPRKDPCVKLKVVNGYCPTYCGIQWCDGYGMLVILFTISYIGLIYYQIVKPLFGARLYKTILAPIGRVAATAMSHRWSKRIVALVVLVALLVFVVVDSLDEPARLQSLSGIFVFFAFGYTFSAHRSRINFRPVVCGFVFQFLLGVICIRWDVGRSIFRCIGDKVATFLNFANLGAAFVYSKELVDKGIFFFSVLPIIFFFSFIISILYYWGTMQWVVKKLGGILMALLGTTVCESVTCSANIFLGMSESPLLIRPYLKHLTASEFHVIISSGFATVSGSVLAAYISFGAEPAHLITSSVMAAPAALGFAKLFYPETEESQTTSDNMVLEKSTDSSVLDAASNGATLAISIVLGVAANLIAFVSFVAFLNGMVSYLGFLVGFEDITFELLFGKLFIPLAWVIGIPWPDCERVAMVIASKTIINEFVAYERLGVLIEGNLISSRSAAIATYAICGFANPSALGIIIATLSTMAPEKRSTIVQVAWRGFVSGSIICFLTASIAGLLMTDEHIG